MSAKKTEHIKLADQSTDSSSQNQVSGKLIKKKLTPKEWAKFVFFLTITIGTSLIFLLTPTLLPSTLISAVLFFAFSPLIDWFERKGISRLNAIVGVLIICILSIATTVKFTSPLINQEVDSFHKGQSKYIAQITEKLRKQEERSFGRVPVLKNANLTDKAIEWFNKSGDKLLGIIPNFASQLFLAMFLVPFITFVLLKDGNEIRRSLLKLVPNAYFETTYSLSSRMLADMGGYVSARLLQTLLFAILTTAGFLYLDIPYAVLLGIFAGLASAIPYLGPIIGAVPALLLAVLDPVIANQLIWVSTILLIVNVIDSFVVFPLIVGSIVNLHPVLVVVSVLLGSQLFGVAGMILAVPVTTILKILISEIYNKIYGNIDSLQ